MSRTQLAVIFVSLIAGSTCLDIAKVVQAVKEIKKDTDGFFESRPDALFLLQHCASDGRKSCGMLSLLVEVGKQCGSHLLERANERSVNHNLHAPVLGVRHGSGTRPAPLSNIIGVNEVDEVSQNLRQGHPLVLSQNSPFRISVTSIYLWIGFFTAAGALHDAIPIPTFVEDQLQRMNGKSVVFGEVLSDKIKRWRPIHSAFPDLLSWFNTFGNANAGLENWGGTSRLCMDWLPFMFTKYEDSVPVKDFLDTNGAGFADKLNIFEPNENLSRVRMLMNMPGEFARYKDHLSNKLKTVKDKFSNAGIVERMTNVFDKVDGRNGDSDRRATEYQLPTSDLEGCWIIMETVLETKDEERSARFKVSTIIARLINLARDICILVLSFSMILRNFDVGFRLKAIGCTDPMLDLAKGGFGVTSGQLQCTNSNSIGSLCWLTCNSDPTKINPVDIDGNPVNFVTICLESGLWTVSELACMDRDSTWQPPYI